MWITECCGLFQSIVNSHPCSQTDAILLVRSRANAQEPLILSKYDPNAWHIFLRIVATFIAANWAKSKGSDPDIIISTVSHKLLRPPAIIDNDSSTWPSDLWLSQPSSFQHLGLIVVALIRVILQQMWCRAGQWPGSSYSRFVLQTAVASLQISWHSTAILLVSGISSLCNLPHYQLATVHICLA